MGRVRGRARAAVVAFGVAFVALQAAFHYPVAEVLPQVRDAHFGRKLARLRGLAAARTGRPLVVATGSSLTELGLCPAVMPGQAAGGPVCYNLAMSNCGAVVHLLALRRILDDGVRPDLVLVEVSPRFLYPQYNEVYDGDLLPPARVGPADLPHLARYLPDPAGYRARWREKQYLPWWSYRGNIQVWAHPSGVPNHQHAATYKTDEWGWRLPPPGFNEAHAGYHLNGGGDRLRAYYKHFFSFPPDPRLGFAYLEMAALCRARGVPYQLVVVPESSFLRDACPADARHPFGHLLDHLRRDYGAAVVDARDWVPDDEFSDGSHVLPGGAARYSQRLEKEVLRPAFPPPGVAAR